ncbi:hypothetical protein BC835DRAFT_495574 [Cytidiella melzeri]|nr:hypothetical protein BC835DRAFT_495574 [Cytidiella melzeri]
MGKPHYHQLPYDQFMALFLPTEHYLSRHDKLPELQDLPRHTQSQSLSCRDVPQSMHLSLICERLNMAMRQISLDSSTQECYTFKDVSRWPEAGTHKDGEVSTSDNENPAVDSVIDIAMYPTTQRAQDAYSSGMSTEEPHILANRKHIARVAWAWITLGIQVKTKEKHTAFSFREDGYGLLRDTRLGREAQEQLEELVATLMARQHRTFVFVLYICRDMARVTRWDRNGCIVSTPIAFETLLGFVSRLALLSSEELGYDRTAKLATPKELEELRSYKLKNPYAAERAKEILDNQLLYPVYKVACPNVDASGMGVYFIGKHIAASYSPTGRATKGYVAFNQQSKRLCFLKDYWRPISSKIPKELDVYKKLKAAGVRYVASVIGGEDLVGQCTVTQIHLVLEEVPLERVHCRLVFEQLARPLEAYRGSLDMIVVLLNALQGHEEAWTKAGVLHRDISVDNVMLVVDQDDKEDANVRGILNDWDLCKYKDELEPPATQYTRCGTWAFMSAVALQYPFKPNELADDLESFIHVLTYCSLRFHRHDFTNHTIGRTLNPDDLIKTNRKNGALSQHVWAYFYQSVDHDGGLSTGGEKKLLRNQIGSPGFTFSARHVSSILVELLRKLYRLLKMHYSTIDFDELEQYRDRLVPSTSQNTIDSYDVPTVLRFENENVYTDLLNSRLPDGEAVEEIAGEAAPTPLPRGSRALDTHAKIWAVFRKAAEQIIEAHLQGKLVEDVTQDQFIGLAAQGAIPEKGNSGSKRKSVSSPIPEKNSKRMRLNEDTASY